MPSTLPASSRSCCGSRPRTAAHERPSGRSHSTRTDRSTITSPNRTRSRTQISPGTHGATLHPDHHDRSPPELLTQAPVQISSSRASAAAFHATQRRDGFKDLAAPAVQTKREYGHALAPKVRSLPAAVSRRLGGRVVDRQAGGGGEELIAGVGLVAAAFRHRTSRAGDPQLHTHVLVANLIEGVDGRWSALDGRRLYAHAKTASYLYEARLRAELTRR